MAQPRIEEALPLVVSARRRIIRVARGQWIVFWVTSTDDIVAGEQCCRRKLRRILRRGSWSWSAWCKAE